MPRRKKPKKSKTRRPGVKCPACPSNVSEVHRTTAAAGVITRERICAECGLRFITREAVALKSDTGVNELVTGVTSLLRALESSSLTATVPAKLTPGGTDATDSASHR